MNILSVLGEYESKLGDIEKQIKAKQEERERLESQQIIFYVPKNLIGLIIGKQGTNIRTLNEQHGVKIIVDDEKTNANQDIAIRLLGKEIHELIDIKKQISLSEKVYEVPFS